MDLHAKLFYYIEKYSGYEKKDLNAIKRYNLFDLAGIFWSIYDRISEKDLSLFTTTLKQIFKISLFKRNFKRHFYKYDGHTCLR